MKNSLNKTPRLHFVSVQKTQGKEDVSQRVIELANADARSHAARVGHQKRKKNVFRPKTPSQGKKTGGTKGAQRFQAKKDPYQTTAYINSGQLDPFVQLQGDLTVTERDLPHDYLTVVPKLRYQTTTNSAFCPVRDTTLVAVATNEVWLSWVVVQRQHRRAELQGRDPEQDQLYLQLKRGSYKLMNKKLAASIEDVLSLETLYGLAAAGVGEHRMSGAEKADKHLDAGLTLLEMREKQGLSHHVSYPLGLVLFNAYVGIGVVNFFKHYVTLVTTRSGMLQRIMSMQSWNHDVRRCVSGSSSRKAIDDEKPVLGHPSREFMAVRRVFGAKDSIVRGHVRCMLAQDSEYDTRVCLAALFSMNIVLWTSRFNESESMEYIEELMYYLINSEPGPVVDGTPRLTNMAMLYIVGLCGSNMQSRYGASRTRFEIWDVIRFVELMTLADEGSRQKMKTALASWLLEDLAKPESLFLLTDRDGERMTNEVEAAWMRKQSASSMKKQQESDDAAQDSPTLSNDSFDFS